MKSEFKIIKTNFHLLAPEQVKAMWNGGLEALAKSIADSIRSELPVEEIDSIIVPATEEVF